MVMAIGEHNPSKLYKRNRGVANMSHQQLHDYASTKRGKLPAHAKGKRSIGAMMAGE